MAGGQEKRTVSRYTFSDSDGNVTPAEEEEEEEEEEGGGEAEQSQIQYFPKLDHREDELHVDDIRSAGTSESSSGQRKTEETCTRSLRFSKDKQGRAISDQPWFFITSHHSPTCFPE